MRDLGVDQRLRDHPDHFAAGLERESATAPISPNLPPP
jgi:hypothetical protein